MSKALRKNRNKKMMVQRRINCLLTTPKTSTAILCLQACIFMFVYTIGTTARPSSSTSHSSIPKSLLSHHGKVQSTTHTTSSTISTRNNNAAVQASSSCAFLSSSSLTSSSVPITQSCFQHDFWKQKRRIIRRHKYFNNQSEIHENSTFTQRIRCCSTINSNHSYTRLHSMFQYFSSNFSQHPHGQQQVKNSLLRTTRSSFHPSQQPLLLTLQSTLPSSSSSSSSKKLNHIGNTSTSLHFGAFRDFNVDDFMNNFDVTNTDNHTTNIPPTTISSSPSSSTQSSGMNNNYPNPSHNHDSQQTATTTTYSPEFIDACRPNRKNHNNKTLVTNNTSTSTTSSSSIPNTTSSEFLQGYTSNLDKASSVSPSSTIPNNNHNSIVHPTNTIENTATLKSDTDSPIPSSATTVTPKPKPKRKPMLRLKGFIPSTSIKASINNSSKNRIPLTSNIDPTDTIYNPVINNDKDTKKQRKSSSPTPSSTRLSREDEISLTSAIRTMQSVIRIREELTHPNNPSQQQQPPPPPPSQNNQRHHTYFDHITSTRHLPPNPMYKQITQTHTITNNNSIHHNEPTEEEWANACQLSVIQLRRILILGREARRKIVAGNIGLVLHIAKRYANDLKRAVDGMGSQSIGSILTLQDMVQEGNMGLMEAAERFDSSRGVRFGTYAAYWVRQRILRSIQDNSRVIRLPVHVHAMLRTIHKTREDMEKEIGRTPSMPELAHRLEMSIEKLQLYTDSSRTVLSLEVPFSASSSGSTSKKAGSGDEDKRTLGDRIASTSPTPIEDAEFDSLRQDIKAAIDGLGNDRERDVLISRFGLVDGNPCTLEETAKKLGISRDRVRMIEARALNKLRHPQRNYRLKEYVGDNRNGHSSNGANGNGNSFSNNIWNDDMMIRLQQDGSWNLQNNNNHLNNNNSQQPQQQHQQQAQQYGNGKKSNGNSISRNYLDTLSPEQIWSF